MTGYLGSAGLAALWARCKSAFAARSHTHDAGDVSTGTLPMERGGTGGSDAAGALNALVPGAAALPDGATAYFLGARSDDGSALASYVTPGQMRTMLGVPDAYELPAATAAKLGGVKVGAGLEVASDGTLSCAGAGAADRVVSRETVSGWEVVKWSSGRMEQRRRFSWAEGSYEWSQWYTVYETSTQVGGVAYAEPFASAPSVTVGHVATGAYSVLSFETSGGEAATCPRVNATRPSTGDSYAIECEVVAVGTAAG